MRHLNYWHKIEEIRNSHQEKHTTERMEVQKYLDIFDTEEDAA
jgi:hypothetical protein